MNEVVDLLHGIPVSYSLSFLILFNSLTAPLIGQSGSFVVA